MAAKATAAKMQAEVDLRKEEHEQREKLLDEELDAKRSRAQEELDRVNQEIEHLRVRIEELQRRRHEDEQELARIEVKLACGQAKLEEEERERQATAERQAKEEEERVSSIYAPFFQDPPAPTEEGEQEWLDRVRKDVLAEGFVFPDRLLEAFHTSVKISEWAPLTVLAGVSGTGKSELPRLYAHFGGLNFLSLAVQPNWDSPQDLLGFFNYMDGRYKATDLLRALVQSQRPRVDGGFDDSMLLVLLDEMNLARIELYFSEFLSRLESRRGAAVGAFEARLQIDVGTGSRREQVDLGKNVLFVGTMNEDETTQVLSDKVVDRGNVIAFPRPTRLKSRARSTLSPVPRRLSRKSWLQRWVKDPEQLDSGARIAIQEALSEINDALSHVNRAIGHRVLQGVEAYVVNHPRVTMAGAREDAWKVPLTDQFAQKVMPKLRGIDCTSRAGKECLAKVELTLQGHAPLLVEDFRRARTQDSFVSAGASYLNEEV